MRLVDHIEWQVHAQHWPDSLMLYGRVKLPGFVYGDGEHLSPAATEDAWLAAAEKVKQTILTRYRERRATFTLLEDE